MSRIGVAGQLMLALVVANVCGIACGQQVSANGTTQPADFAGVAIEDVRLGFNGVYKVGHWTPLAVTLRSSRDEPVTGKLLVDVADGDGVSTSIREENVTIAAGKRAVIQTLFKPGRPQGIVKVRFESPIAAVERTFIKDEPPALLATQELFLEVGQSVGLARLRQFYPATSLELPAGALEQDPRALPTGWLGYSAVDIVGITTSQLDLLASWDTRRADALEQWVRLGGKLILCVGRNGKSFTALRESSTGSVSPLSRFLPGRVLRVVERGPGRWETFAAAEAEGMQGIDGAKVAPILTTQLEDVRGHIQHSDGSIPLVVRTAYGFGEVLFVAADLDQPPLATWSARTKLLLRLLDRTEISTNQGASRVTNTQSIRLGYTDLSGQLRAALGQYDGARMVPFWPVFLLALGYAAVVFPVEFVVARWLRPRFEAAWLLLPLVLVASAIAVWYLAAAWKGRQTLVNKIEVVDVDLSSGVVRGQAWLSLYSPKADRFDLRLAPRVESPDPLAGPQLSWLGLPGNGLGGMNSQMQTLATFEQGYRFDPPGSLSGVPMSAWSSKSFEAPWHASATSSDAQLGERASDQQPQGTFKNHTGLTLRDCVLLYNHRSYLVGTLEPGASVDLASKPSLQNIQSYLTERRTVGDKEQATPFEPDGTDLGRIVKAMLFHQSAGGHQYTSLSNRTNDRLDMTGQLRLGRAVLLATGPPATRVDIRGRQSGDATIEQEIAFYRFVIPVDRGGSDEDAARTIELRLD